MNLLSAMLWAWAGVCVLSLAAAAVVVRVEVRLQGQEPGYSKESRANCELARNNLQAASQDRSAANLPSCGGEEHASK